jgi:Arc-like DNA binding domain
MAKSDTQTSLRIPTPLRDRLQEVAELNGRGLGQEIVERLRASFLTPSGTDEKTANLLEDIAAMAKLLADGWAPWHAGDETYKVFKDAIPHLLEVHHRPEPKSVPMSHRAKVLFEGENAAERLGTMVGWRAI